MWAWRPRSCRDIMKVCGACQRILPVDAFSVEQQALRQSIRRCTECAASGNQLVLMKRGTTREEDDVCSVCQMPLPIAVRESMLQPCCMKRVCNGCLLSARKSGIDNNGCPFCRAPFPGENEALEMVRKRATVDDPLAICFIGCQHGYGGFGFVKDAMGAIELCRRAASLGAKDAHYILAHLYREGSGEVVMDGKRSVEQFEKAAMQGHIFARFNLGVMEYEDGRKDIALQHFLISAKMGHEDSMGKVQQLFMEGAATKADYDEAQERYDAAVEEMSSPSREEAEKIGPEKIQDYGMSSP